MMECFVRIITSGAASNARLTVRTSEGARIMSKKGIKSALLLSLKQ